jgi:perosamine synthetase
MNPYGKYNGKELEYVSRALDSETPGNGDFPWVTEFEDQFCNLSGAKYAIAVNSATSGLHAALIAAGVESGDEVIQPGLTVIMNSLVTLECGAIPVYTDINPDTWNIDVSTIEKKITNKTKAIMAVSLFGLPLDIDPIMELARSRNIIVIDDSAETLCGEYKGKFAGVQADMTVFSFENKKHITSGSEGGMIITSNDEFALKCRKFSGLGYKNLTPRLGRSSLSFKDFQNPDYERHDSLGLNYRMNTISAAVGLAQLERAEHIVARRVCVGEMFNQAIQGCSWIIPQAKIPGANHTYFTFGARYEGLVEKGISWQEFYEEFVGRGGDGFYAAWKNPYLEPALRGRICDDITLETGLCPIAEDFQKKIMLFKTNYRNLSDAAKNARLLSELVNELGR